MATEAQESVIFVEAARQRAKGNVGLAWLAVALYAAFAVTAVALGAESAQGKFFWIVGAPFVVLAAFIWAFFDGRERGVEASRITLVAIPFGLLTISFAIGALGLWLRVPLLAEVGPPMSIALGYIGIGVQRRERRMVLVGVFVIVLATALVLINGGGDLSHAILGLAYVVALLVARIGWRLTHAHRS